MVVCANEPLAPCTVIGYVPPGVIGAVEIVSVDEPEAVMLAGLNDAVAPAGSPDAVVRRRGRDAGDVRSVPVVVEGEARRAGPALESAPSVMSTCTARSGWVESTPLSTIAIGGSAPDASYEPGETLHAPTALVAVSAHCASYAGSFGAGRPCARSTAFGSAYATFERDA